MEGNFKRFVIEVLLVPENNNTEFQEENDDGIYSEENLDTSFQLETHVPDIEENKHNIYEKVTKLESAQLKFPKNETLPDLNDTEPASDAVIYISDDSLSAPSCSHVFEGYELNLKNDIKNSDKHTTNKLGNVKKNYICSICDISFTSRARFKLHTDAHSKNKPYKCNACDYTTIYKSNLTKHMSNIHYRENDIYVCNICDHSYTTVINYAKHMSLHSAGNSKLKRVQSIKKTNCKSKQYKFKCNLCKYSCNQPNGFAKHMRLHSNGCPVHKCGVCNYITDDLHHFQAHLGIHSRYEQDKGTLKNKLHSKGKSYKCNQCKYKSDYKDTFAKHMELHLKGGLLYKCTICHYITDEQQHFDNHVRAHLRNELPKLDETSAGNKNYSSKSPENKRTRNNSYKCNICKYSCPTKVHFANHMELHLNGDAKYKCGICHYITSKRRYYARHMNRHSIQGSIQSTFQNKDMAKTEHTNVKPYKCNICKQTYITELNYAKHMSIHSAGNENIKNNKYKCKICKYSCTSKIRFDKHMELHSKGSVKYKCGICHYITNVRHHYFRHMENLHSVDKSNVIKNQSVHSVNKHMLKHNKKKKFNCNICKFSTLQNDILSKHMKEHSKFIIYKCNICKHSCDSSRNLALHKRLHSIWKKCKHCNYFASSSWKMEQHMSKHYRNLL